jgi:hypothetical protein
MKMANPSRPVEATLPARPEGHLQSTVQSLSVIVTVAEPLLPIVQPEEGRDSSTLKFSMPSLARSLLMVIHTDTLHCPGWNVKVLEALVKSDGALADLFTVAKRTVAVPFDDVRSSVSFTRFVPSRTVCVLIWNWIVDAA